MAVKSKESRCSLSKAAFACQITKESKLPTRVAGSHSWRPVQVQWPGLDYQKANVWGSGCCKIRGINQGNGAMQGPAPNNLQWGLDKKTRKMKKKVVLSTCSLTVLAPWIE